MKILLVEDERLLRDEVAESLRYEGFDVKSASDGAEGLDLIQDWHPDLVLTDVAMPKKDGFRLLSEIRSHPDLATLPVVMLTAKADREDYRRGMILGADDYLTKPFTHEELSEVISGVQRKLAARNHEIHRAQVKAKHELATYIPHELLTPLNGIIGFADLLELDAPILNSPQVREMAHWIKISAFRLQRTLDKYNLYLRTEYMLESPELLQEHRSAVTKEVVVLTSWISRQMAAKAGRTQDLHLDLEECAICFDEASFETVLRELLDNALRFSQPMSSVRVTVRADSKHVLLTISDSGCGISQDQIASISPFTQFNRTVHEQQGLGLGLYIVRRLVESSGGLFDLSSVEDVGTTVRIYFRRAVADSPSTESGVQTE